jgi:choice-of-anchor A domain-containing protein
MRLNVALCRPAAIVVLLGSTSLAAQAQTLTAAEILDDFNAVIINDFNTTSDVEGRLVAGVIQGGATFYNKPSAQSGTSAFQAVNAITISGCSSCNVDSGGSVNYVNSNGGHFNFNGGGKLQQNSPAFSMAAFTTPLNALATSLTSLTANSTINASDPNNFTFNIKANSQGVAVFDVTASELATARNLDFANASSASAIIINVTGAAGYAFTQQFNFNDVTSNGWDLANHVIWNFENAGSLSLEQWQGAVLASGATVSNSSPINGFLYAANYNGNGELHDRPFLGSLSAPGPVAGSGLIPSALAFGGLLFWRRRRASI